MVFTRISQDMDHGGETAMQLPIVQGRSATLLPRDLSGNQTQRYTKARERRRLATRNTNLSSSTPLTKRVLPTPTQCSPHQSRKLVLHFDVRNTVLVADSVTHIGVEEALNSYLTGVAWGLEGPDGGWEWLGDGPSLRAPTKDAVTYYKYMEKIHVKIASDRGTLRQVTGNFTDDPVLGKTYKPHYARALEKLKWTHPNKDEKLIMRGKSTDAVFHYLLPSVFRLVQYLTQNNRDFAVVIRTYGEDAPNVLKALNYGCDGNHPLFQYFKQHPFRLWPVQTMHSISRKGTTIEMHNSLTNENLTNEHDMYSYLNNSKGACGFVDDFLHWQTNNYSHFAGKPFWLDPGDDKYHHIFFDDNFRPYDQDSIVDVRIKRGPHFESVTDVKKLENVNLVQVDLLEAIEDVDYFVNKVNTCEKNFSKLKEFKNFLL